MRLLLFVHVHLYSVLPCLCSILHKVVPLLLQIVTRSCNRLVNYIIFLSTTVCLQRCNVIFDFFAKWFSFASGFRAIPHLTSTFFS